MTTAYLLAIDQGTTNSRAIIFNQQGQIQHQHELGLSQFFPHDGWVEQDPEEIFRHTVTCCHAVLTQANSMKQTVAAVGISNQRETTIIWDRQSGKAIYPAIVWQDRRTHELCDELNQTALKQIIPEKTGLLIDPYFSATKILWMLENVPHARERAMRGELLFGTIDTFLLWRLTNGKSHFTDATNASRTLLFNIHTNTWDDEILTALNIPKSLLPTVLDNTADFGEIDKAYLGAPYKITAMIGDQQAATVGQACFDAGMMKTTYGTGCFMLLNTGEKIITSKNQLLATIAYRHAGKSTYGLEGSIFSAGVIVKWLRDTLQLITTAAETESIAASVDTTEGVYVVPAFTGLGAPYWDPKARAAILGLTRNSSRAHIIRAALESVAYQTNDLLQAMMADANINLQTLRVDGGMTANHWLLQFIADMVNVTVERPPCIETTALGAAFFAGLQIGVYQSITDIARHWEVQASFKPKLPSQTREDLYRGWQAAVARVLTT